MRLNYELRICSVTPEKKSALTLGDMTAPGYGYYPVQKLHVIH